MIRRTRLPLVALAVLAAGLFGAPAAGQGPSAVLASGEGMEAANRGGGASAGVAAELAVRWAVDASAIRVDWGGAAEPAGTTVRLLGNGSGGTFVAEVSTEAGIERHRVRAGVRATLAVAARDLERGTVLGDADMARRDTLLWGGPRNEAAVEPGWEVRRRITAGTALLAPAVGPVTVVEAGQPVKLVWRGGGVEVTTRATAAGTASVGERVAVRTESGRRVWGVAESRDVVRIEGGRE